MWRVMRPRPAGAAARRDRVHFDALALEPLLRVSDRFVGRVGRPHSSICPRYGHPLERDVGLRGELRIPLDRPVMSSPLGSWSPK